MTYKGNHWRAVMAGRNSAAVAAVERGPADTPSATHKTTVFRFHHSGPNSATIIGPHRFAAAQSDAKSMVSWGWHREHPETRSFATEPLVSLAGSPCGALVAAGGVSGAVRLWCAATGHLLREWTAHYRSTTCLAFSTDGARLVTGGEDTVVRAWDTADLADAGRAEGESAGVRPSGVVNEHTLPITGLALGHSGGLGLVAACSADASWTLSSLAYGLRVLRKGTLPGPATCVAIDSFEHAIYIGMDDGRVAAVPLLDGTLGTAATTASATADADADQGDGAGPRSWVFRPHRTRVHAIAASPCGTVILTGGDEGAVRWSDPGTGQVLREAWHPGRGGPSGGGGGKVPVTSLIVLPRPLFSATSAGRDDSNGDSGEARTPSGIDAAGSAAAGRAGPPVPGRPLAVLAKHPGVAAAGAGVAASWDGPPVPLGL